MSNVLPANRIYNIMKILSWLVFLLPLNLFSQALREVMPLVEENKVWVNERNNCMDFSGNRYYHKFVMQGDTAIGNYVFKKVQVQPYRDSFYFMRETDTFFDVKHSITGKNSRVVPDTGKFVYALYPGEKNECLLYFWKRGSFPMQHGIDIYRDSVFLFKYNVGIGALGSNFYPRKNYPARWNMENSSFRNVDTWQERVGSVKNLFYNDYMFFYTFNHYRVNCVWKDDTLLYSNLGVGENCMKFIADFTFSDQCLGDTSRIRFHSCDPVDHVTWDLGDGTVLNGIRNEIIHYYPNAGDYPITMTAVRGTDTLRLSKFLVIRDKPGRIDLGEDTIICGDHYKLSSNVTAYKYLWSTGDISSEIIISKSGTYAVIAGHNSCIVTDTINVQLLRQPDILLDTFYSICEGSSINLNAGSRNYGMNCSWSNGATNYYTTLSDSGWYDVKISNGLCRDSTSFFVQVRPFPNDFLKDTLLFCSEGVEIHFPGVTMEIGNLTDTLFHFENDTVLQVKLKLGSCSTTKRVTLLKNLPQTNLAQNQFKYCTGDTLELNLDIDLNEHLTWPDGSSQTNRLFVPKGRDTVLIKIGNNTCSKTDTFYFFPILNQAPFLVNKLEKCPKENKTIRLPGGFLYSFNGNPIKDSLTLKEFGEFVILMTDTNGCKLKDTLTITESLPYKGRDTTICAILPLWFPLPDHYLDIEPANVEITATDLIFTHPANYTIFKEDSFGCKNQSTIIIEPDCQRLIPNAFSPNNDGLNDVFSPLLGQSVYTMLIFDRWGGLIFEDRGQNISWDGKYKDQFCSDGVYFYLILLENPAPNPRRLAGPIELLR